VQLAVLDRRDDFGGTGGLASRREVGERIFGCFFSAIDSEGGVTVVSNVLALVELAGVFSP
jgi:hypothetical protein